MSRPIKELPTLTGEATANFLKRADAAERRYKERKEAGTLRDITKDPGYISMKKILKKSNVYFPYPPFHLVIDYTYHT